MNSLVRTLTGLTILVAGSFVAGPAGAAAPEVDHTRVEVSLTGIDQCGFTVDAVTRGTNTFQVSVDRFGTTSYQDTAHVVSTLTDVANRKVVYVDSAGRDAWSDGGVANPDGTTTYTDVLTGRDTRIYTSHSSVLVKDVGYLAIVDTVDAQGELVSEQLVEHGPHEFAGDFSVYCDAIAAALG